MNVLISWSGTRSKELALALKDLLPVMIQSLKVWVSDRDIDAGSRWLNELNDQLDQCNFGIVCLTPENLHSDWILYEAGAIAKSVNKARVVSYLLDLKQTDVEAPLSQFQNVSANKKGTSKLLSSLNNTLETPLPTLQLKTIFDKFWPDLNKRIKELPSAKNPKKSPQRPDRELLEEILIAVRKDPDEKTQTVRASSKVIREQFIFDSTEMRHIYRNASIIISGTDLAVYSLSSLKLLLVNLSCYRKYDLPKNRKTFMLRAIHILEKSINLYNQPELLDLEDKKL